MNQDWSSSSSLKPLTFFWILFAIGLFFVTRTLNIEFEADDLRFLWWAHTHSSTPWKAFLEDPLFGQYFRPLISMVWWLHLQLLGPNAFLHQWALGCWWLAILLVMVQWGRAYESSIAGCAAVFFFLLIPAGHHVLLWKSWLTSLCSILFQLGTLLCLAEFLRTESKIMLRCFVVCYLLALCSKQSASVCLSVSIPAMIFFTPSSIGPERFLILTWVLIADLILFIVDPSLRFYLHHCTVTPPPWHDYLPTAAFYAETIWPGWVWKGIGAGLLLFYFLIRLRAYLLGFIAAFFTCILSYGLPKIVHVSVPESWALGMMIFPLFLWFTPLRKRIAAPLAWMMASFWMLPFTLLRWIPYAADCGVALSLVMAPVISLMLRRAYLTIRHGRWTWREYLGVALTLGMLVSLPGLVRFSYQDLAHHVDYTVINTHLPLRLMKEAMQQDTKSLLDGRTVYADLGEHLSLETELCIAWSDSKRIAFQLCPPPPGAYRLEAFTGKKYWTHPSETPLNLWVDTGFPPASWVLADPYFAPEQWTRYTLSDANQLEGWSSTGLLPVLVSYPLGVYGPHILFDHREIGHPFQISFTTNDVPADLTSSPGWVLTFWMQTPRWEWVDAISLDLIHGHTRYIWDSIALEKWNPNSPWKRALLHMEQSRQTEIPENDSSELKIVWTLHLRTEMKMNGVLMGIDEVQLSTPKAGDTEEIFTPFRENRG